VACNSLYVPCAAIEPCEIPWDEHEQVTPHKWATYFCVYLSLQCNDHAFTTDIMISDKAPRQINQTKVHTVAQLNQLSSTSAKDWEKTGKLRWCGETTQFLLVFSIYKRSFSLKNTVYIAWQLVKKKKRLIKKLFKSSCLETADTSCLTMLLSLWIVFIYSVFQTSPHISGTRLAIRAWNKRWPIIQSQKWHVRHTHRIISYMEACTTLLEEPMLIFIIWIIKKGEKVYLVCLVNLLYQKEDGADYSCCTDSKSILYISLGLSANQYMLFWVFK
jgi:hypothetical protein